MAPASDESSRIGALEVLTAQLQERMAASDRALLLQAPEIMRRLGDLNHAHVQAQQVQATYVPRELFNSTHADIDKRVKAMEDWRIGLEGGAKTATLIARGVWAVIGGVVGVVALYFWQFFTGQLP